MDRGKTIAVDLDGTLTITDTLHESLLLILRNKPLLLFKLPLWLVNGKSALKAKVVDIVDLDVSTLPYNKLLIDWLKDKRANGKRIVLCSATNEQLANAVADHLQIFDDVIASDTNNNVKGVNKRKILEKKFGKKGYDYVGNSIADIPVWEGAREAVVVNASRKVLAKARQVSTVSHIFSPIGGTLLDWCKAIRLHQWLKNLLLFVPLLAAHQITNAQSILTLILSFISFSLCASSVYITNDLLDLESDRRHPNKRNRPFAAGTLSIVAGIAFAPLLLFLSILLGLLVDQLFLKMLILYFLLTTFYSLILKRIALIDCLTLAILFTMRIVSGGVAISIPISFWLMAFSLFIFLSLAFLKRFAELVVQVRAGKNQAYGRDYADTDASLIQILGVVSGYLSVLVLALYLSSEKVKMLYAYPAGIWFAIVLLLFWISWVWLKAHRGEMHDDPIVFAIKDKASIIVAIITGAVFILSAKGEVI